VKAKQFSVQVKAQVFSVRCKLNYVPLSENCHAQWKQEQYNSTIDEVGTKKRKKRSLWTETPHFVKYCSAVTGGFSRNISLLQRCIFPTADKNIDKQ
jgi:hypothetical protein